MIADFTKNYEKLLTAIQLLQEVSEDFKLYSEDALKEITSEQQDLLHIIENGTVNANDQMKIDIVNHLQEVRHIRRNIKKIMEMSELFHNPLTTFLTNFQTSKHQLTTMKNSFDTPIYRIRNQHIYQTYLEKNTLSVREEQPHTVTEQHPITYVKSEQELIAQIKEKNNKKLQKQQLSSNQENDFEKLLAQQNISEENHKLKQEDIERLEKQTKNKNKKNKAKAMKQLKALKIKENKQTVLDLFKELERQRQQKK